jgi:hypothetical protein
MAFSFRPAQSKHPVAANAHMPDPQPPSDHPPSPHPHPHAHSLYAPPPFLFCTYHGGCSQLHLQKVALPKTVLKVLGGAQAPETTPDHDAYPPTQRLALLHADRQAQGTG